MPPEAKPGVLKARVRMACIASMKDISQRLFIHSLIHFCLIIHLKNVFFLLVGPSVPGRR